MADPTPSSQLPTEDTLASVHRALALLHQLQCSVSGFQLPSQLVLLERLNGLVSEFGNMHSASQDCHIQIPLEVLNFIDEGRNPDEYTKHLLNGCIQQNQASKGKVDSFKALRKHLLEQVEEVFPAETEAYRDIRNQSSLTCCRSHEGHYTREIRCPMEI
nr:mediator of RNA polymerase II transcription subunit 10b-like isoform X2 [Physcomitrium patens]|eukprot:XP_024388927.1 mediator of RNA polymerase II transcription subunit 10b-like isoform X2 [Physcomitrella patens]